LSNALSTTIGQALAILFRILLGSSICIIYFKGENFSIHLINSVVIKRLVVSWIVRILNTRVMDLKVCSKSVKDLQR